MPARIEVVAERNREVERSAAGGSAASRRPRASGLRLPSPKSPNASTRIGMRRGFNEQRPPAAIWKNVGSRPPRTTDVQRSCSRSESARRVGAYRSFARSASRRSSSRIRGVVGARSQQLERRQRDVEIGIDQHATLERRIDARDRRPSSSSSTIFSRTSADGSVSSSASRKSRAPNGIRSRPVLPPGPPVCPRQALPGRDAPARATGGQLRQPYVGGGNTMLAAGDGHLTADVRGQSGSHQADRQNEGSRCVIDVSLAIRLHLRDARKSRPLRHLVAPL